MEEIEIGETENLDIKEIEINEGENKYIIQIQKIKENIHATIVDNNKIKYKGFKNISNILYKLGIYNFDIDDIFDEINILNKEKFNLIKELDKHQLKIEFKILNKKRYIYIDLNEKEIGNDNEIENINNDNDYIKKINELERIIKIKDNKIRLLEEELNKYKSNFLIALKEPNLSVHPNNPQSKEQIQSTQLQGKKLSNPKTKYFCTIENHIYNPYNQRSYYNRANPYNQYNQISYYNRTNPNISPNLTKSNNSINSKIVKFSDIIFLQKRIMQISQKIKDVYFSLRYRASEDGDKAANFHEKCDEIGPNIVLIKTGKGSLFGGFTFRNWKHLARDIDVNRPNLGSASRDSNAFGFNVNIQKIYNNVKPKEFAIWCNRNYGPTFKNNLFQIFDQSLKKGGYCNLRKNSNFGGQMFDYEISGGEARFKIEELEVFEVRLL